MHKHYFVPVHKYFEALNIRPQLTHYTVVGNYRYMPKTYDEQAFFEQTYDTLTALTIDSRPKYENIVRYMVAARSICQVSKLNVILRDTLMANWRLLQAVHSVPLLTELTISETYRYQSMRRHRERLQLIEQLMDAAPDGCRVVAFYGSVQAPMFLQALGHRLHALEWQYYEPLQHKHKRELRLTLARLDTLKLDCLTREIDYINAHIAMPNVKYITVRTTSNKALSLVRLIADCAPRAVQFHVQCVPSVMRAVKCALKHHCAASAVVSCVAYKKNDEEVERDNEMARRVMLHARYFATPRAPMNQAQPILWQALTQPRNVQNVQPVQGEWQNLPPMVEQGALKSDDDAVLYHAPYAAYAELG